jgi:inosine-uridine nucleoside N-ribohydrolase
MRFLFILVLFSNLSFAQKRVWLDADVMIGLKENAPREVDDAIALMVALRHSDKIDLVGISTITNVQYATKTTKNLLKWYHKGKPIPVFSGSDKANDLGIENEATKALTAALRKEKLTILAIGPLTNIGTVLKNHPELVGQINEVVVCAGRTANYPFKLGLGDLVVWDYNFETDVEGFRAVLESNVKMVFSGFECSESLLLGRADISFLNNESVGDKWVYNQLVAWQNSYKTVYGVPAFIPWDTTPLGYITHPQYFKFYEDIPVKINRRQNDANVGPNVGKEKYFLEVSYEYNSPYKATFAYKTKLGFEEIVIDALKRRK